MKHRVLITCVLAFCVVSILTWGVVAQGRSVIPTALVQYPSNRADLAYTRNITFTPVSILHIPLVRREESGWSIIAQVNDGAGASMGYNPNIAIDSTGIADVAWIDTRMANQDIFFASRLGGEKWLPNEKINDSSISLRSSNVAIGADGSGNAYAIWDDRRDYPNNNIYFAYRPANGAWGTNMKVNESNGGACCSDIAVDPAGNAFALWEDGRNQTGGGDIYFSYKPKIGNWETNLRVSEVSSSTIYNGSPAIAIDEVGNAYALWIQNQISGEFIMNRDVMFSYRPAGGQWGINIKVNDTDTNGMTIPDIAVDTSGDSYAIWCDIRSGNDDIWFAYRPAGGNWSTNIKVNDDVGTTSQAQPSITLDGTGNAYAVWLDQRNGQNDIYFAYLPKGGTWGPNIRVNDRDSLVDNYFSFGFPRIAIDSNSGIHVVWTDVRHGNADIFSAYQLWRP